MKKIYYSRYHIITAKNMEDKLSFIMSGVSSDAGTLDRGFLYKFFNSEIVQFAEKKFITGELVKYNPNGDGEVVDDRTVTIQNTNIHNQVVAKARFIIDLTSSILLHFEIPNAISNNNFRKKFSKLFEENHENFFTEFSITPIKDQYSFRDKITTFKSIKRISIMLFPSNPNSSERWKSIDERMRKINVDKYKEIQETSKPNANIQIDEDTESKFLMAEDGYGECDASGIDNLGNECSISTKDSLKHVSSTIQNDISTNALEILSSLASTLQTIIERTQK